MTSRTRAALEGGMGQSMPERISGVKAVVLKLDVRAGAQHDDEATALAEERN